MMIEAESDLSPTQSHSHAPPNRLRFRARRRPLALGVAVVMQSRPLDFSLPGGSRDAVPLTRRTLAPNLFRMRATIRSIVPPWSSYWVAPLCLATATQAISVPLGTRLAVNTNLRNGQRISSSLASCSSCLTPFSRPSRRPRQKISAPAPSVSALSPQPLSGVARSK